MTERPQITVEALTDDYIRFHLKHVDTSIANALRRIMIAETRTLAVELAEVFKNTSALHDEFIVHRLGLLPLRYNDPRATVGDSFLMPFECCGEACSRCALRLTLDYTNNTNENVTVTSRDIKVEHEHVEVVHFASEDERKHCEEEDQGIAIVELGPGQGISCVMLARLGIGKLHAKFQPTCSATYHFIPEIRIDPEVQEKMSVADRERFVDLQQIGVFRFNRETNQIEVESNTLCNNIDEVVLIGKKLSPPGENVVSAKFKENEFIFHVETNGSLKPEELVRDAINVLEKKTREIGEEVKKLNWHEAGGEGGGGGGRGGAPWETGRPAFM